MGCHQGRALRIGATGGRCVGTGGTAVTGCVAEPQETLPRRQLVVTGSWQTSVRGVLDGSSHGAFPLIWFPCLDVGANATLGVSSALIWTLRG
jgi:hypothetical protein